jgi:hypothetical protein
MRAGSPRFGHRRLTLLSPAVVRLVLLALALFLPGPARAAAASGWTVVPADSLRAVDDDVARNSATAGYFDGLEVSEYRFGENGFNWHLLRFRNPAKPDGPLWMVPHDDENGAFEAMIAAVREYGGVGIAVNSGPGSLRLQAGRGECGGRRGAVAACDPNRNFAAATPLFTAAFLDQRPDNRPVIALHTNSPGFSGDGHGGSGDTTILDRSAFRRGRAAARAGAVLATNPQPAMANYDTLGLAPYAARERRPTDESGRCGLAIAQSGIHFWHERVRASDGSMSNYLALNRPDILYFNAESRTEADPAVAAARHRVMIAAYLRSCVSPVGNMADNIPAGVGSGGR